MLNTYISILSSSPLKKNILKKIFPPPNKYLLLINKLKEHIPYSLPFHYRVSRRDAPNYYDIIKNPMDLNTMSKKYIFYNDYLCECCNDCSGGYSECCDGKGCSNGGYSDGGRDKNDNNITNNNITNHTNNHTNNHIINNEFKEDLELIWNNCFIYNAGPIFIKYATEMKRYTDILINKNIKIYKIKKRDGTLIKYINNHIPLPINNHMNKIYYIDEVNDSNNCGNGCGGCVDGSKSDNELYNSNHINDNKLYCNMNDLEDVLKIYNNYIIEINNNNNNMIGSNGNNHTNDNNNNDSIIINTTYPNPNTRTTNHANPNTRINNHTIITTTYPNLNTTNHTTIDNKNILSINILIRKYILNIFKKIGYKKIKNNLIEILIDVFKYKIIKIINNYY